MYLSKSHFRFTTSDLSGTVRNVIMAKKRGPCSSLERRWGAHLPLGGREPVGG